MATLAETFGYGLLIDRPAAGVIGRYYTASDDVPVTTYRDNGATWDEVATVGGGSSSGTPATDAAAKIYAYLNFR